MSLMDLIQSLCLQRDRYYYSVVTKKQVIKAQAELEKMESIGVTSKAEQPT